MTYTYIFLKAEVYHEANNKTHLPQSSIFTSLLFSTIDFGITGILVGFLEREKIN